MRENGSPASVFESDERTSFLVRLPVYEAARSAPTGQDTEQVTPQAMRQDTEHETGQVTEHDSLHVTGKSPGKSSSWKRP